MKKFMIRCDMEGATGIVSMEQSDPSGKEYDSGRNMFNLDLRAVIEGLNEAGADEIYVYDEHFYGRNVELADLPKNIHVICGKPPYRPDWAGGLDSTFAGLVLVGLHSMALTPSALLAHTYEEEILEMDVNGTKVGEIGLETMIAGEMGVPLILVTADSEGIREAKELVPDVEGVSVKESLGDNSALCYPCRTTRSRIKEAAARAAFKAEKIKACKSENPAVLTVTLKESAFLDRIKETYAGVVQGNKVVLSYPTLLEAYSVYWTMKLACSQ